MLSHQRTRKGAGKQDRKCSDKNCFTAAKHNRQKSVPQSYPCQQRLNGEPRFPPSPGYHNVSQRPYQCCIREGQAGNLNFHPHWPVMSTLPSPLVNVRWGQPLNHNFHQCPEVMRPPSSHGVSEDYVRSNMALLPLPGREVSEEI